MRNLFKVVGACAVIFGSASPALAADRPHNVVIFVADGLRYGAVTAQSAPNMWAVAREGVDFADSHAQFPTLTTPNAASIATGHGVGDTGDFANSVYVGARPVEGSFLSLVPFLEDDVVLGGVNARFGGNYLGRDTLLSAAAAKGFQTAVVGKLGPAAIQDVTARAGRTTLVVDDSTGYPEGLPLPSEVVSAIKAAGLAPLAPDRGLNSSPDFGGVHVANVEQQDWFAHVAADVLLPRFKAADRPFVLVFWSRDPDGTQHNQGDSPDALKPGINGPTTLASIRNADDDLGRLRIALKRLGLEATTDIVVTADHGFSVTSKESATSASARASYPDVPKGELPPGFLALDLAKALGLPVFEPNGAPLNYLGHPKNANAVLGRDPTKPDVVIGANGGADLIWLPTAAGRAVAGRIAAFLTTQDYSAGLFADDALGPIPGALPTHAIGLKGAARTPAPDLVVSFRSGSTGCADALVCAFEVADTALAQGQGIHGSFSRADGRNMMAASGPDFRRAYVDPAPVGNIDWAPTLAHVVGLELRGPGELKGRVMAEALSEGAPPPAAKMERLRSTPAANGFVTTLDVRTLGGARYPHAAGTPGKTVGLDP